MSFDTQQASLAQWLQRLEALHPSEIELGLARISRVAERLDCLRPAPLVILVGGTNGKGTTSALLSALLQAQGLTVGLYCSPHIHRYNERVQVNGREVSDADLCAGFRAVEVARGETSLTYFEFGTLAALHWFKQQQLDACVLEIGLGGRLDAVNIVDADISVVTSIGLDHQAWLGDTVEQIGYEKAGIARAGRWLVCGQPQPPATVRATAETLGAHWCGRDDDFSAQPDGDCLQVRFRHHQQAQQWRLPAAHIPYPNVATAIQALALLERLPDQATVAEVLQQLRVVGRLQHFVRQQNGQRLQLTLDVAHNEQAAAYIGQQLGRVDGIILGMLADKDPAAVLAALPQTKQLLVVGLDCPRGLSAAQLAERIGSAVALTQAETVAAAMQQLPGHGHWLVCGSFYTVEAALAVLEQEAEQWNCI